jgi:hypothetical protein
MNFLVLYIQNMKFGPGNNKRNLILKINFSKKSIFRLFQKKSQILIFFQHVVQKIEKYKKSHVLGNFVYFINIS